MGTLDVLLVVTDDEYRRLLVELLGLYYFKAIGVKSAKEALLVVRANWEPALVVVDLTPIDNLTDRLLGPLTSDEQLFRIPLVLIMGPAMAPARDKHGPLMLHKPVNFRTLLRLVERYCATSRAPGGQMSPSNADTRRSSSGPIAPTAEVGPLIPQRPARAPAS